MYGEKVRIFTCMSVDITFFTSSNRKKIKVLILMLTASETNLTTDLTSHCSEITTSY